MSASENTPVPNVPRPVTSSVNGWYAEYLDGEYHRYKADPESVSSDVRAFFQGFELAQSGGPAAGPSLVQRAADNLLQAYRVDGHVAARLDPFGRPVEKPATLQPASYGVTAAELKEPVKGVPGNGTLAGMIEALEAIYCGSIGAEFMHAGPPEERSWFIQRLERTEDTLSTEDRLRALQFMTDAERFDAFFGKRYQGKKRFSLEGGEALIPCLKFLTQRAGELGVQEMILGMPHRGRLSVLRNYLGKDLGKLITEFEDSWSEGQRQGGGDVKYHRGYSGDQRLWNADSVVHLSMMNNPSHLESVNPLVMGRCRAKQDAIGDNDRRRVVSVLLHGDAAVIGQGIVAECLNMSQLEGYTVGGTIHIIVNNQVGFTTDPSDARSTRYCTDIGKMINAPVLHVNGDDPEAVVRAARIAAEYRNEFRKDIFIDIVCFRRYGHNEQDEPNYTQPLLYAHVREHPGPAERYRRRLISEGIINEPDAEAMAERVTSELNDAQEAARSAPVNPVPTPGGGLWAGMQDNYSFESPATTITRTMLADVCNAMGSTPEGFNLHPKLKTLLQDRRDIPTTGKLNHADAELLAVGALLLEGTPVRLSGQDSRRGTFTQRHAVLRDEKTGERYTPLNNIRPQSQAVFSVWDSPLSEFSVMGFDYGYTRAMPKTLVMWEAQFGDFVNGAQIIIDQYLASSEVKWSRWAGLVLLLPHGHEGQGPEHSSARLERFLQLAADDNMEIVYPSTAAQTFHMLRRQAIRNFRKPLVVMTPKKFLRVHTSTVDELLSGAFRHAIDDPAHSQAADAARVTSVLYCSGKIYHELAERRALSGRMDTALVRIEQLYPFHAAMVKDIDARYPKSARRVWVQEEPRNQGAYLFMADTFRQELGLDLQYIGRAASSSPATGSEQAHKKDQEAIISAAVGAPASREGQAAKAHSSNGAHPAAAKPEPERERLPAGGAAKGRKR
ncbi:MAG: 2-oxoglutarate dehydrogenase E1 component [Phycisphaeraceae bacterium]|nr:2-oxoglutarate dehydrogenase E1 component [Phycisphaeraceae bacterium]